MAQVLVDVDMPDGSTDRIRIEDSVAAVWATPVKEGEDRPTCTIVNESLPKPEPTKSPEPIRPPRKGDK